MEFVSIDVETANADLSSICQIGIACCSNGTLKREWVTYIDPEDYFSPINVGIHGIDESVVKDAPKLPKVIDQVYDYLDYRIAVCHTHFDRVAVSQATQKYALRAPQATWLDSARVARRTWSEFAYRGYGLHNICCHIGYDYRQHDALEDARAAAMVMMAAINHTGIDIEDWLLRVSQPIGGRDYATPQTIRREGNPQGPLYGNSLVFTGSLTIPRTVAAEMAAEVGCAVQAAVNKNTTIVVLGSQDIRKLAGQDKSAKHRRAEDLIRQGQDIRILGEHDFVEMCRMSATH